MIIMFLKIISIIFKLIILLLLNCEQKLYSVKISKIYKLQFSIMDA